MVANDIFQAALLDLAAHCAQVAEALVLFRMLGTLGGGKHGVKFHGDMLGVDHDIFGIPGVDIAPVYGHDGGSGVEIFVFQSAYSTAIYRIGEISTKGINIKMFRALSDFFIRSEGNPDGTMWNFWMLQKVFSSGYNGTYASLVIGS